MIREQKKALRKQVRQLKAEVSFEDKLEQSKLIFAKLENVPIFKNAKTVLLYWSLEDEVQTHDFIEKWWEHKTILLPSVEGDNLKIKVYQGKQSMVKGELFDILEPVGLDFTELNRIDLIIVPGVAFDKNKNRMGRGRGYYDKLLTSTQAYKLGVCFDFQFFDTVPVEKHDLPMDEVVTIKN